MRKVPRCVSGIFLALVLTCLPAGAGDSDSRKREYIPYHETSRLKRYNPNAVWRHDPCQRCNGTGFRVVLEHDHAKNRTIKRLKPCLRCRGRGTKGMSKM